MSVADPSAKYWKTKHRGLSYRLRGDGSKTFYGVVDSRRVKLVSTTERDALAEYSELRVKKSKGEVVAPSAVKFRDLVETWFTSKEAPKATSTRTLYRSVIDKELVPFLGHRKLTEIDLDVLLALVGRWEKRGLSRSTVESYLAPVRQTFDYAVRRKLVGQNPCTLLRGSDLPEAAEKRVYEWSTEEIDALVKASRDLGKRKIAKHDYAPMIELAVYTGLRLGELCGLQWSDVHDLNGDRPTIVVQRQHTRFSEITAPKTKAGKRRVPLWPEAVAVLKARRLQAFAEGRAKDDDPVFLGAGGTRVSHRNIQRRGFAPARDAAGLPESIRFHDLRHAFASLAAHRGVPLNVLSVVMGHSNVAVTANVYVHLFGREDAEAAFRSAGRMVV